MNSNEAPQTYPLTRFAAIVGVEFARTNDQHPAVEFQPGGVMLSEIFPGEFAIIITARPCTCAITAMTITDNYRVISDTERLQVHWTSGSRRFLHGPAWLYLRFEDPLVFADFNRVFWDIIWDVKSKIHLMQERLENIAFRNPSNFIEYCRQYLGDDYFDGLEDLAAEGPEAEGFPLDDEGEGHEGADGIADVTSGSDNVTVPS